MSKVEVIALDAVNNHQPGDKFEVSEREAVQLIEKGLVKMSGPTKNKMAAPLENKANPSQAAGGAQRSSASRAARVSPQTTAKKSAGGGKVKKTGRS